MVPTSGDDVVHGGTSSPSSSLSRKDDHRNDSSGGRKRILSLRKELCKLVAGLSTNRSEASAAETTTGKKTPKPPQSQLPLEVAKETLDPFFADLIPLALDNDKDCDNNNNNGSNQESLFRGTTPLVIACDRGNLACVLYFCQILETQAEQAHANSNSTTKGNTNTGLFWEALIGSPLQSETLPDKTKALHHCTTELAIQAEENQRACEGETFLQLLERICMAQKCLHGNNNNTSKNNTRNNKSNADVQDNFVLRMGASVNTHGDTPLMMAVTNSISFPNGDSAVSPTSTKSSARAFLEEWYQMALESCAPSHQTTVPTTQKQQQQQQVQAQSIRMVLNARNELGHSILYYATTGGIPDVLQWLIDMDTDRQHPIITAEETLAFRKHAGALLSRDYETLRENVASKYTRAQFEEKQRATEQCVQLLEAHVAHRSEQVAQELWREELAAEDESKNGNHHSKQPSTSKKKKKKKRKKKQQQQQQLQQQQQQQEEESKARPANKEESSEKSDSQEARVEGEEESSSSTGELPGMGDLREDKPQPQPPPKEKAVLKENHPSAWYRKRTFSLDETNQLLRDRYRQGSTKKQSMLALADSAQQKGHGHPMGPTAPPAVAATTTTTTATNTNPHSDADSVLSALCLDVNCLLYSDYGMALNLSPAQLDAVEDILREQLQSVTKARVLQERRSKIGGQTRSN